MEDVEHEGDSSSQSASTITQCRRGANGRVQIDLSDGSSFFVSERFCSEHALLPGGAVSEELLGDLEGASARILAWDKSGELLARRDHSVFELSQKLRSRGFDRNVIDAVVDMLRDAGFLDDRRFAEAWVRSRLRRHPEGQSRLLAGLVRRGVHRSITGDVLGALFTEDKAEDAITRAAEKILRTGDLDKDTLSRKLASRGFTYRQIQTHLQDLQ
jgi:regulatory protein